jgi:hypothetical protein
MKIEKKNKMNNTESEYKEISFKDQPDQPEPSNGPKILNNIDSTGLLDELTPEENDIAVQKAKESLDQENAYDLDLNLDEDVIKNPGQNYAVVSFVGPSFTAKTETNGIRVMGIFDNIEDAQDHIVTLEDDSDAKKFDTGIVELYKFVPSYPFTSGLPSTEEEQQAFVDNYLNKIIINHKTKMAIDREKYHMRKDKLMKNRNRIIESDKKPDDLPAEVPKGAPEQIKKEEGLEKLPRDKTHQRLIEKMKERKRKLNGPEPSVSNSRERLNLLPCSKKVPNQNFVAITFVKDPEDPSNERIAMKIKGAFNVYEECEEFCKQSIDINNTYDILTAEMYTWLPCNPDIEKIEDHVHDDETLNNMFSAHKKEKQITMNHHKERVKKDAFVKDTQKEAHEAQEYQKDQTISASDILKELENEPSRRN